MFTDAEQSTFVAIAVGFVCTILLLWGRDIKRTEIFGHAILFAALGYYLSGVASSVALSLWKVVIERPLAALMISGFGGSLAGPWLKDRVPAILDKKAGIDD
jgi:hypothetical protein